MSGVDDVMAKVRKTYGQGAIVSAEEVEAHFYNRLPTGVLGMDMAFLGGWPQGSYCSVYGPEGAGKTAIGFRTIAAVQNAYGPEAKCAYLTMAGEMDRVLAAIQGVQVELTDKEKMAYVQITGREDPPDMLGSPAKIITQGSPTSRLASEGVLDLSIELLRSGECHLVVLDELGGEETKDYQEANLKKPGRLGSSAQLYTRWGKKVSAALGKTKSNPMGCKTTLLVLSQIRATILQEDGSVNFTTPEPKILRHIAGARISLVPKSVVKDEDTKALIGKSIEWEVQKGRYGVIEGDKGRLTVGVRTGIDLVEDTITTALGCGVIDQKGAMYSFEGKDSKVKKVRGIRSLADALREDPVLLAMLRGRVHGVAKARLGE